jgi:hypothetical protein
MEGESIYGWIKEEAPAAQKAARHRSKYDPKAPLSSSTFGGSKKAAGTFGRSVKEDVNPGRYLRGREKTGAGVDPKSKPAKFERTAGGSRKPAVPRRGERPVHGLKSEKNFVVANAVENILAVPKRAEPTEPDYLRKADFGKVPAYLAEVKKELEAEKEFVDQMLAEQDAVDGPRMRELSEDERDTLLLQLKEKWGAVNEKYQRMTFKKISTSNSTAGAIRRKEECETMLSQLEKDIERLSAKGPIYVVDDEEYGY